jgi:hypothetical protein
MLSPGDLENEVGIANSEAKKTEPDPWPETNEGEKKPGETDQDHAIRLLQMVQVLPYTANIE